MTVLVLDMNTDTTFLSPTMGTQSALHATADDEATMTTTVSCKRRISADSNNGGSQYPPTKRLRVSNNNNKKRVRFAMATNNSSAVQQSIHIVPRVEDEDIPLIWYTAEEFYHQRRCDLHSSRFFAQCRDDTYRNDLFQVLGTACGKLAHTRATEDACLALASSPIRGLERETTVCFRQRKKQVVANVLKSQASLQAWKNNKTSTSTHKKNDDATNYASRILAAHYHKLAQPAGRFARLLGKGDAQFVNTNVR